MAYAKQTWATGDTITAEKLNHMEDGIAQGGTLLVNFTYDPENETYTCNKTFDEVYAAVEAGTYVYAFEDQNNKYLALTEAQQGEISGGVYFEYTQVTLVNVTTFVIALNSDNTTTRSIYNYPNS